MCYLALNPENKWLHSSGCSITLSGVTNISLKSQIDILRYYLVLAIMRDVLKKIDSYSLPFSLLLSYNFYEEIICDV